MRHLIPFYVESRAADGSTHLGFDVWTTLDSKLFGKKLRPVAFYRRRGREGFSLIRGAKINKHWQKTSTWRVHACAQPWGPRMSAPRRALVWLFSHCSSAPRPEGGVTFRHWGANALSECMRASAQRHVKFVRNLSFCPVDQNPKKESSKRKTTQNSANNKPAKPKRMNNGARWG
jgi:hypothetical protein